MKLLISIYVWLHSHKPSVQVLLHSIALLCHVSVSSKVGILHLLFYIELLKFTVCRPILENHSEAKVCRNYTWSSYIAVDESEVSICYFPSVFFLGSCLFIGVVKSAGKFINPKTIWGCSNFSCRLSLHFSQLLQFIDDSAICLKSWNAWFKYIKARQATLLLNAKILLAL